MNQLNRIIQELSEVRKLIKDGGPTSGNFGHGGRPGKIGGSSEGESTNTPEENRKYGEERIKNPKELNNMSKVSKDKYLSSVRAEKEITKDVTELNKLSKMSMLGEKYAIKQPESYKEKISDLIKEKGWSEEQAVDSIHDCVRYTSTSSPKNLVANTKKMLKQMEDKGYTIQAISNTWRDDTNPYSGINVKVLSKDGTKFEMQFHTPQSFDMKERKQHKDYEEYRKSDITEERKKELSQKMFAKISGNKKWTIPTGIDDIKSFTKAK